MSNPTRRSQYLKSVTLRARLEETPEEYILHLYTPGVAGMPDGTYFSLSCPKHDKAADEARDKRTATLHYQELVRSYIFHKTLPGLAARYMTTMEVGGVHYWEQFILHTDPSDYDTLDRGALYSDFIVWCQENEVVNVP